MFFTSLDLLNKSTPLCIPALLNASCTNPGVGTYPDNAFILSDSITSPIERTVNVIS